MLVLTRKENETIRIGNDIEITLIRVKGGGVRIGIDAPKEIKILRGELEPCDGENFADEVFAHGEPMVGGEVRNRLPMAGAITPIRQEQVRRGRLVATAATTTQTVSA